MERPPIQLSRLPPGAAARRRCVALLGGVMLLAALSPALAADNDDVDARKLVASGRARPIDDLLGRVHEEYAGKVLTVEAEVRKTRVLYDVKLLGPNGHVIKLEYDARTLRKLRVLGAPGESADQDDDQE